MLAKKLHIHGSPFAVTCSFLQLLVLASGAVGAFSLSLMRKHVGSTDLKINDDGGGTMRQNQMLQPHFTTFIRAGLLMTRMEFPLSTMLCVLFCFLVLVF